MAPSPDVAAPASPRRVPSRHTLLPAGDARRRRAARAATGSQCSRRPARPSRLSHHETAILLLGLALLLLTARVCGEIALKLHQPAVIGELLAGVALGPTLLGAIWPGAMTTLFPPTGPVAAVM